MVAASGARWLAARAHPRPTSALGKLRPDGTLRFNSRAAMLEPSLLEYVVVHLMVKNHSCSLWNTTPYPYLKGRNRGFSLPTRLLTGREPRKRDRAHQQPGPLEETWPMLKTTRSHAAPLALPL